jgi:2-methylisocitrate lyase-like PEP mutase family enzyme
MSSEVDLTIRRAAFARRHEQGCFVIPNPWDVGSARYLEHLGFEALATTSSGFAFSHGLADSQDAVPLEMVLAHVSEMAAATNLALNVDFASGYAHDPNGVAANVRRCVDAGASGLSIEDLSGDPGAPLYPHALAVDRIASARSAIDHSATAVVLTARTETFTAGVPNALEETVVRLQAYAAAGADVLFAPGVRDRDSIATVVAAVAPKPVNVLMSTNVGLGVADLAALGVRRVSVGSGLARVAWGALDRAARGLLAGSFEALDGALPFSELSGLFGLSRN